MSNVNVDQLLADITKITGFDLAKEPGPNGDAFKEVLADMQAERQAKAKVKAKEILQKVEEAVKKIKKLDSEYKKTREETGKELNKLVASLQAALNGKPAPDTQAAPEATAPVVVGQPLTPDNTNGA